MVAKRSTASGDTASRYVDDEVVRPYEELRRVVFRIVTVPFDITPHSGDLITSPEGVTLAVFPFAMVRQVCSNAVRFAVCFCVSDAYFGSDMTETSADVEAISFRRALLPEIALCRITAGRPATVNSILKQSPREVDRLGMD